MESKPIVVVSEEKNSLLKKRVAEDIDNVKEEVDSQ